MDVEKVTEGDAREALTAIRDELAVRLSTVQRADAVAPIAKALIEVIVRIDGLPDDAEGSVTDGLADELAQRRARSSAAGGGTQAAGS